MKSSLIKLIIGIVLAIGGYLLFQNYSGYISQKEFDKAERICLGATIIDADLKEVKKDKKKATYSFDIEGKNYQVKKRIGKAKKAPAKIKVWYEKDNPSSNMTEDPCPVFEEHKNNGKVGNQVYFGIVGGLLALIGLGFLLAGIKSVFRTLNQEKPN